MALSSEQLEKLIYESGPVRRFTQDSPVMPDVWLTYLRSERADLLLTPHTGAGPGELAKAIHEHTTGARVAHSDTYVVAELTFEELVTIALPLTAWWHDQILGLSKTLTLAGRSLLEWLNGRSEKNLAPQVEWLVGVVGRILCREHEHDPTEKEIRGAARKLLANAPPPPDEKDWKPLLWQVSRNRTASLALWASRPAVKADAAVKLFDIDCSSIVWAVIDCGIDARHPGLCSRKDGKLPAIDDEVEALARTRVEATYDFTSLRDHVDPEADLQEGLVPEERERVAEIRQGLKNGRSIDWSTLEPVLRVSHGPEKYKAPKVEHGTHVAGILSADWTTGDDGMPERGNLTGIAPGLRLYDLRVITDAGECDEFSVIAALQFVRWLNGYKDKPVIHGVNLSLAIPHDFTDYACGKTPVCQEAERLAATGVVVVAAAGNQGYAEYKTLGGEIDKGFRSVSITDPGNAEEVITVGGTHRSRPFSYGVSYFSSRGPTGDGRFKPDLVAPGEKIISLAPEAATKSLDGTSMAAPHVSGAAALLMARTEELVGDSPRVKSILCASATDLGRERYFQGAGMLDVLRALQSV